MCPSPLTSLPLLFFFFFFNDTATTEIYTLSLHDALPISLWMLPCRRRASASSITSDRRPVQPSRSRWHADRKSTRLNSSHSQISYAVFCLKKKKKAKSILEYSDMTLLEISHTI